MVDQDEPRQRSEDDRQPTFVVRAPDSTKTGRWVTLGYAWPLRNGDGFSVKLNSIPVGSWDGALVLLPPLQGGVGPEQSSDVEVIGR